MNSEDRFWLSLWIVVIGAIGAVVISFTLLHLNSVNKRDHDLEMGKLGLCRINEAIPGNNGTYIAYRPCSK